MLVLLRLPPRLWLRLLLRLPVLETGLAEVFSLKSQHVVALFELSPSCNLQERSGAVVSVLGS